MPWPPPSKGFLGKWPDTSSSASLILCSPPSLPANPRFMASLPVLEELTVRLIVNPFPTPSDVLKVLVPSLPAPSALLPTLDRSKHSPPTVLLPLCCWALLDKVTSQGLQPLLGSQCPITTLSHIPPQLLQSFTTLTKSPLHPQLPALSRSACLLLPRGK